MKRHVHITDKVDQKLERVLNISRYGIRIRIRIRLFLYLDARPAESFKFLQDVGGIPDSVEDVDVRPALPSLGTGESARGTGIVVRGTDVVQGGSPPIFTLSAGIVCPCCDGRQVALPSKVENITEFRHHGWVQVHLRDGRDDFVAYGPIG